MKKILSLLLSISLLLFLFVVPIHASNANNARWVNTKRTIISHDYLDGNAACRITITGYSDAIVTNVDISFDQVTPVGLINIATWNDLSGGQYFTFYDTVPNIEADCVYRLSFTADVVKDGVIETISDHFDRFYVSEN